jgi:hypothetical protein
MKTDKYRITADRESFMKDAPLLAAVVLLLISAIVLAMINTNALYVDAAVFVVVGCIAYVGRKRP